MRATQSVLPHAVGGKVDDAGTCSKSAKRAGCYADCRKKADEQGYRPAKEKLDELQK